ncbi:hypothetical protein LCGC14_1218520 [marine sediment metagenome]|uniref:Uncharacterized protein n=1 Tax=marine sediment metagenome TaxID=412755 RepID=A0A0F9LZA6_9ZZZZ
MDKKEQTRERVKRYRERQTALQDGSVTEDSVTEQGKDVTLDVTQYPAILHALTDPDKRCKLEAIVQSLKNHHQVDNVFYGHSGLSMSQVGEMLDCTR